MYETATFKQVQPTPHSPGFGLALIEIGMVGPLLLVTYAYTASADAVEQLRIILQGGQAIVAALLATAVLASLRLLRFKVKEAQPTLLAN